ncbi:hypothetical protein [Chryseobacterium sp. CT-SW4]|uniref:hypothetical protein n=1 Tax=Chryseobacterium sp. SW-1 TaxID=3157343 RepID=UPI003B015DD9
MKTLFLFCFFILSFSLTAQTKLTKDYETYAYFMEDESNKNDYYVWLYDGESYTMNFPKTITGLESIRDKVEYIAGLSGIEEPSSNTSIIPDQYKDVEDTNVAYRLIMDGKIGIFLDYVIDDRKISVMCTDRNFRMYITTVD